MIDERRFWKHVTLLDDSREACWVWVGTLTDDGRYGRFWRGHRDEIRAHWAAWEVQNGKPVPAGYLLKQKCATPQCVRHWELSGKAKKLTPASVSKILASMLGPRRLARKFGVSEGRIRQYRKQAVLSTRSILGAGEPIA